jgi:hypothetical protein
VCLSSKAGAGASAAATTGPMNLNRFKALLGAIQVLGKLKTIRLVELQELKDISNFRAPDLNWKNFSGGPDI